LSNISTQIQLKQIYDLLLDMKASQDYQINWDRNNSILPPFFTARTKVIQAQNSNSLAEKMQLPPGTVSPFGLLNNEEKDIRVYFDKDIVSEEIMTFHPNTNEKTIFIKTQDLFRFLESIDFSYEILTLP